MEAGEPISQELLYENEDSLGQGGSREGSEKWADVFQRKS